MPYILQIVRGEAAPAPGLSDGGNRWRLTCYPLPQWIRELPPTNPVRKSLIWDLCRELRTIEGLHQIKTDERDDRYFIITFSTVHLPGIPREIHGRIEQVLGTHLYSKTPPAIGEGNDI